MESEHIHITDVEDSMHYVFDVLDDYMKRTKIKGRNALRLTLLTEEALKLVKSIVTDKIVTLWLVGDANVSRIMISAEGIMDVNEEAKLVSVSKSQKNHFPGGFFAQMLGSLKNIGREKATWTLNDYKLQLLEKRNEDIYAQDAWDDLERSLLANLADDVVVSIDKMQLLVEITKIFTDSLVNVGSKVPKATSGQIILDTSPERVANALEKGESYVNELSLSTKDAMHLKLVFEETVGMLKELAMDYEAVVWFERYDTESCLRVVAKTEMNAEKKADLIGLSASGKNAAATGFMDKVVDVIDSGMLGYEDVTRLQQEYGGGIVGYGGMGVLGVPGGSMVYPEVFWSLNSYRDGLSDMMDDEEDFAQQAWDELEKSIVASIAKDVIVGVKNNRVDITVVIDLLEA